MLKRLELAGFKSFAGRTSFDFSAGLTGVIGPNGSGKSNVVDAIKWALGEQSAKSLRGGEMADVIFNGSATRKSLGMAEVTLTFDNTRRQLAYDADEVAISRRVYRSGESEYLLSGQLCRLKDIKDVLLGSGAGSDAYCIIEQGRVDQLLQTGAKERRAIFEEAAGISRFRARKAEALRRLERVAANMERLQDILDEVEKSLRTANAQAAKARTHQQYTARLRELSLALSLREYHGLTTSMEAEAGDLRSLREALRVEAEGAESGERELAQTEARLAEAEPALAQVEAALADARQRIAAESARREAGWAALSRAESEASGLRSRAATLRREARAIEADAEAVAAEAAEAAEAREQAAANARRLEADQASLGKRRAALLDEAESLKNEHLEGLRDAARWSNEAVARRAELDSREREHSRLQKQSSQAAEDLASLDLELEGLTKADEEIQQQLATARERLSAMKAEREALERSREDLTRQAADLRAARSGLQSRVEVLQGLEASQEGLGTGAREVLAHLMDGGDGPWRTVVGLAAEALTVRREFAPLIDLILGERAQRFLIRSRAELAEALKQRGKPLSGRASFLHLSPAIPPLYGEEALSDPAIVALAEDVVHCDPAFTGLPRLLLGQTVIVHDLEAAESLAPRLPGWRLVTLAGEVLEPDGTVTVGSYHSESGILSRRSELADLAEEIARLDERAASLERHLEAARARLADLTAKSGPAEAELAVLAEQAADMRSRLAQHQRRRDNLTAEVTLSRSEMTALGRETATLRDEWEAAQREQARAEAAAAAARSRLEEAEREARALEEGQAQQQKKALEARVALAQAEERHAALGQRLGQLDRARSEKLAEADRASSRLGESEARLAEAVADLLRGSCELAEAHREREAAERTLEEGHAVRSALRERRNALLAQARASRSRLGQRQEAAHAREIAVRQLEMARGQLTAKMRDDYQVDLDALYRERLAAGQTTFEVPTGAGEGGQPIEPESEIIDLRRRLTRLGAVNLDSLAELEELQGRHSGLRVQYDDLQEARSSLEATIARINSDCRKLFTEAFEAIRDHFQALFRKLFGGGMADVVLEEGVDILESGIEIVARPPGKELRSISQMSGGEKTMTAVALLLAIFRSRPSPFCILDEVDAALDEANVARLASVLVEFAAQTQFIVITHRHRTMAAIPSLIGVTMAESGVSTRCSVRLEDWVEEGRKAA
jgi:chromosome segregation protein